MNWNKGFTARYYATVVDPKSWVDTDRFEITGGTISHSLSDLIESADISCTDYPEKTERWVRVYLDARQGGDTEHVPLFTGLATSPNQDINGRIVTNAVECYSVLKPADDVLLPLGWYAPVGIEGSKIIQRLLAVTPAPVVIEEGSPTLKSAIIADGGESNLSMVWKVVNAINWRIRITGGGTIHVCPKAKDVSATFDPFENDSIEPTLSKSLDWYDCPNVFRATTGDTSAVAVDNDPSSMFSVENRGREVWAEESNVHTSSTETLQEYARRRLKELQEVYQIVKYDRRFFPDVLVTDIVRLRYPIQELEGIFVITNQTIELGYGARTSEEVRR